MVGLVHAKSAINENFNAFEFAWITKEVPYLQP